MVVGESGDAGVRPACEERVNLRSPWEETMRSINVMAINRSLARRSVQKYTEEIPGCSRDCIGSRRRVERGRASSESLPGQSLLDLLDGSGAEGGYIGAVEAVEEFLYRKELQAGG